MCKGDFDMTINRKTPGRAVHTMIRTVAVNLLIVAVALAFYMLISFAMGTGFGETIRMVGRSLISLKFYYLLCFVIFNAQLIPWEYWRTRPEAGS